MRAAAATILLLGAGLLTGHALGDTVPVPTVPTVTVSTPVVTVPITVPTLPTTAPTVATTVPTLPPPPVATTAVKLPASTTTPAPLPQASSVAGSATGPGSTAGITSSGGSPARTGAYSSSPGSAEPSVERFRTSRTWIATTGPKSRRVVTLTFRLPHSQRVFFVVQQVAPTCRTVDRFVVRGHAGRNRIRFPARPRRFRLVPGTYRISVQTRGGLLVQRVTIVVVDHGRPSRDEIAAARAANVCPAADNTAASGTASGASNTSSLAGSSPSSSHDEAKSHPGAVLGASLARAARAIEPLLVGLLGLAIALLGIAALPRVATNGSAANDFLVRYRIAIAGLGATALTAAVIVLLG
jgi:hypothetical protein